MTEAVSDKLHKRWLEMRDDCGPSGMRFSEGVLIGLLMTGAITSIEEEGWRARFERCPGHQGGSRVWCGYCGDVCAVCDTVKADCKCSSEELADAVLP